MCSPVSADSLELLLGGMTLGNQGEGLLPLMPGEPAGPGILLECIAMKRPMTCEALAFYLSQGCLRDSTLYKHIHLFSPNQDSALMLLIHHGVPIPEAGVVQLLFQRGCTQQTLHNLVSQGVLSLSSKDYEAAPFASEPMLWIDLLMRYHIPPLPRTLHQLLKNLAPDYVCSDFFKRVYQTFLPQTQLDADLFNLVLWHYRDSEILRELIHRQLPMNLTTCLLIENFGLLHLLEEFQTLFMPILEGLSPPIGFIYDHDPLEPVVFDEATFHALWEAKPEYSADLLNLALLRGKEEAFIIRLIDRQVRQDSVSLLIMKMQGRI